MALQWYLTRYAKLGHGKFELLTYDKMPNLEVAQHRAKVKLPNNEFYEVECKVGSLIPPTPKPCWITRDEYSHKPYIEKLQVQAEIKAQQILDILNSDSFDVKDVVNELLLLKPLLIKAQYNILLDAIMQKPTVQKLIYDYEEA